MRITPTIAFFADGLAESAQNFEDLLSKVREQDKELAALREGAAPAGEADPYKIHKARGTDTGE